VDIAKAFDTVLHSLIGPCLRKRRIPTPIIQLINEMCKNCKTLIRTGSNNGVEVQMMRRVKQGDPLSPLPFNVCLDPLLEEIQRKSDGINTSINNKVSVLAFADDIILLGKDEREAQMQLELLNKYLGT
jgi:hypothetical protein